MESGHLMRLENERLVATGSRDFERLVLHLFQCLSVTTETEFIEVRQPGGQLCLVATAELTGPLPPYRSSIVIFCWQRSF